jgi:hypothetical protein
METLTLSQGRSHAPREPLAALVARIDLAALVEQYAGPGRRSGKVLTFSCPNPAHADRHPSFTVDTHSNRARCWSQCDFSGDALDLVRWLEGLDVPQAAARLRAHLGECESPAPITRKAKPAPVTTQRRAPLSTLPGETVPDEVKARHLARYCEFRRWPLSVVEAFGLDVVRDKSGALRVRHSYFAPTASGEWVAAWAQDRGPAAARAKWLSTPGAPALPYNLASLERDDLWAVVITEGPADAITAALALESVEGVGVIGVPGAHSWQMAWARLTFGLRVVIVRDNDLAGEKFAERIAATLPGSAFVVTPPAKDLSTLLVERDLGAVSDLLERALGEGPEQTTTERDPFDRVIALIGEAFPGSFLVEEVEA